MSIVPDDVNDPKQPCQSPPRVRGAFASVALAMSTICILAGGLTSFPQGFCSVGGASIGLGWPLFCLISLTVALTMGHVASAFPRAGGPYQWAAELGGAGWGWVTGCFNLAGLITVLAAINVGVCQFLAASLARQFPWAANPAFPKVAVVVLTAAQALINHRSLWLTVKLTDASGILIIAVAVALTLSLIAFPLIDGSTLDPGRLVEFHNFSGLPEGDEPVWPATDNLAWLFALGLLLPAYTITGFDAPAQAAEETLDPQRNVPRGIVQAVLISGLAGWVMLSAAVLAIPGPLMGACAAEGDRSFFWIFHTVLPHWLHPILYAGIIAAQCLCGLATMTAASRLTWALARDNGLVGSRLLRRIGRFQTPSAAVWTTCGLALAFALLVPYSAIASVCAMFLYIAYVFPTAIGLLTYPRWGRLTKWGAGWWYRPLAAVAVLGCLFLIVIGMQPPNLIAVPVVAGMIVGLVGLWFAWMRHYFRKSSGDTPIAKELTSP
jgi:amino acid transporter